MSREMISFCQTGNESRDNNHAHAVDQKGIASLRGIEEGKEKVSGNTWIEEISEG